MVESNLIRSFLLKISLFVLSLFFNSNSMEVSSPAITIKIGNNDVYSLNYKLMALSPVLSTYFEYADSCESQNRCLNLSGNFLDLLRCSSKKSFNYFVSLLKNVLDLKSGKKTTYQILKKIRGYPLAVKIDCAILAEYFDISDLFNMLSIALSNQFSSEKSILKLRLKEDFFKLIYEFRAPEIRRLAALYIIELQEPGINKLFAKLISRKSFGDYERLTKILDFNQKENVLLTSHSNYLLFSHFNKNKSWKEVKLNNSSLISCASMDESSKFVGVGLKNGEACVWSVLKWKIVAKLKGSADIIKFLKFNKTSKKLAAVTNYEIFIWDLETEYLMLKFNSNKILCSFIDFFKGSNNIIFANTSGEVNSISLDTGKIKNLVKCNDIEKCALHPNNRNLVTISSDGTIRLWDICNKQLINSSKINYAIRSIKFSPVKVLGNYMVLLGYNNILSLWDFNTLIPFAFIKKRNANNVVFTPEGNLIASSTTGNVQEINISGLRKLFYENDYLLEHMLFFYLFLDCKRISINQEKDHIKLLYNKLPEQLKKIMKSKFLA